MGGNKFLKVFKARVQIVYGDFMGDVSCINNKDAGFKNEYVIDYLNFI